MIFANPPDDVVKLTVPAPFAADALELLGKVHELLTGVPVGAGPVYTPPH